jgi:hypothetical protein
MHEERRSETGGTSETSNYLTTTSVPKEFVAALRVIGVNAKASEAAAQVAASGAEGDNAVERLKLRRMQLFAREIGSPYGADPMALCECQRCGEPRSNLFYVDRSFGKEARQILADARMRFAASPSIYEKANSPVVRATLRHLANTTLAAGCCVCYRCASRVITELRHLQKCVTEDTQYNEDAIIKLVTAVEMEAVPTQPIQGLTKLAEQQPWGNLTPQQRQRLLWEDRRAIVTGKGSILLSANETTQPWVFAGVSFNAVTRRMRSILSASLPEGINAQNEWDLTSASLLQLKDIPKKIGYTPVAVFPNTIKATVKPFGKEVEILTQVLGRQERKDAGDRRRGDPVSTDADQATYQNTTDFKKIATNTWLVHGEGQTTANTLSENQLHPIGNLIGAITDLGTTGGQQKWQLDQVIEVVDWLIVYTQEHQEFAYDVRHPYWSQHRTVQVVTVPAEKGTTVRQTDDRRPQQTTRSTMRSPTPKSNGTGNDTGMGTPTMIPIPQQYSGTREEASPPKRTKYTKAATQHQRIEQKNAATPRGRGAGRLIPAWMIQRPVGSPQSTGYEEEALPRSATQHQGVQQQRVALSRGRGAGRVQPAWMTQTPTVTEMQRKLPSPTELQQPAKRARSETYQPHSDDLDKAANMSRMAIQQSSETPTQNIPPWASLLQQLRNDGILTAGPRPGPSTVEALTTGSAVPH